MADYRDQTGFMINLRRKPLRIISLVPSQSEFLWELGLREELVGITKFCVHPQKMFTKVARVGGTKTLSIEKIRELKPDLIIGNKEENERSQIEELRKEFRVWMSDIYTLDDSMKMMISIGDILDKRSEVTVILTGLKESFARIKDLFARQRVAYFIWNKPYMLAAKDTFIDHILNHLGFINAFEEYKRYPEIDEATLKTINPAICFLSSEPFPFKEKHVNELRKILPHAKILIVDGEVFSWYGTRLLHLENYLNSLSPGKENGSAPLRIQ